METLFILLICIVCFAILISIVSGKYSYFKDNDKAFFNDRIKYTEDYSENDKDKID